MFHTDLRSRWNHCWVISKTITCWRPNHSAWSVHDPGIYVDANLSMRMHVKRTVSRCFAALHQLRQIHRAVPDACSGSGTLATGLRQCNTGWHPSLPVMPSTVGAQCGSTTHLPLASVWPHLWRIHDTALAVHLEHVQHKVAMLTY